MSEPYVGEIRMFGGTFAPLDWAFCDGSLLPISENEALFSLIGTTYGGDGQSTFALPDLRGRVPLHQGSGFTLGQGGGVENVTLTPQQLPAHGHPLNATSAAAVTSAGPSGMLATSSTPLYGNGGTGTAMAADAISVSVGGGGPHNNMAPFLAVNFIIALFGIFPSSN